MSNIYDEACRLASAGIAVFPVKGKQPATKNGYHDASTDLDQILAWFQQCRVTGIGVPMAPNGLVCFDLDYGHTEDKAEIQALEDWEDACFCDDYMYRSTNSGGAHIICGAIDDRKPPAYIMPYLDVRYNGYIVWMQPDGGYKYVEGEKDLTKLAYATPAMYKVVTRQKGVASDGGLISIEQAWQNIEDGVHIHESILSIAQDKVTRYPNNPPEDICELVEVAVRDIAPDGLEQLDDRLEWKDERGELWRAVTGAHNSHISDDFLEQVAAKMGGEASITKQVEEKKAQASVGEWLRINGDEVLEMELESLDWIIENSIPAANLISFAGPSGAGKTRYIALLMASLMTGRTDLIGLPQAARPISSMYIANEERGADIQRRIKSAMVANNLKGGKDVYVRGKDHGRFVLTIKDGDHVKRNNKLLDALVAEVLDLGVELVIFDPFVTLGAGGESNPDEIDQVNSFLIELATRTGAAVGHVHHTPKDRSAAPDAERALDGAWRGHGSIYSALDMGETIFPFIPSSVKTKQDHRRLMNMQKTGDIGRYVALDSVKVREGHALPFRLYELTEEAVNKEGQMIGCLRYIHDPDAVEGQMTAIMNTAEMNEVVKIKLDWAEKLFELAGGETVVLPMKDIHQHMQSENARNWSEAKVVKKRDQFVENFFERMKTGVTVQNCTLSVLDQGRSGVEIKVVKNV